MLVERGHEACCVVASTIDLRCARQNDAMGDHMFLPKDPENALNGEVVVGANLPQHAVIEAASLEADKLKGDNEVIEEVELGSPLPYGEGGVELRQPFRYWVRQGP